MPKPHRNTFTVCYQMGKTGETKMIDVIAESKYIAYDKATHDMIPNLEKARPHRVWVKAVTYQNGNYREFNTCPGTPF